MKLFCQDLVFLHQRSNVNVQSIGSIPTVRLERKIGELDNKSLVELKGAISYTLDIK